MFKPIMITVFAMLAVFISACSEPAKSPEEVATKIEAKEDLGKSEYVIIAKYINEANNYRDTELRPKYRKYFNMFDNSVTPEERSRGRKQEENELYQKYPYYLKFTGKLIRLREEDKKLYNKIMELGKE